VKKSKGKPLVEGSEELSDPRWELVVGTGPSPWDCCIPFPLPTPKKEGKSIGRARTGASHPRLTLVEGTGKEKSEADASGNSAPSPDVFGPHPDRSA
jgi:hypothetical protein